jgi:hypothetical protein
MVPSDRPRSRRHRHHRSIAAALLAAALALLAIAGCGGGGGSSTGGGEGGSESQSQVASKIDAACVKVNGYAVWLPEHVRKTHESIDEATAAMHGADDEFRSTLEALDPPAELVPAIEEIEAGNTQHGTKPAAVKAQLRKTLAVYREVGAEECAAGIRAGLLVLGGASVKDAYRQVGRPVPPRPAGW